MLLLLTWRYGRHLCKAVVSGRVDRPRKLGSGSAVASPSGMARSHRGLPDGADGDNDGGSLSRWPISSLDCSAQLSGSSVWFSGQCSMVGATIESGSVIRSCEARSTF
jgi:hypothetical protein